MGIFLYNDYQKELTEDIVLSITGGVEVYAEGLSGISGYGNQQSLDSTYGAVLYVNSSKLTAAFNGYTDGLSGWRKGGGLEYLHEINMDYVSIESPENTLIQPRQMNNVVDSATLNPIQQVVINRTPVAQNGALPGKFSVAENKQVQFSQGNLQYNASGNIWKFAEQQFIALKDSNKNISPTYDGWIDLFAWGTGANPTSASAPSEFTDWGTNAISNGGNEANIWHTLSNDDWKYLFFTRPNAASLLGYGKIEWFDDNTYTSTPGIILLPDNWTQPEGVTFKSSVEEGFTGNGSTKYTRGGGSQSDNEYDERSEWHIMASNGAVFIPVTGRRTNESGSIVFKNSNTGYYWLSNNSYGMYFLTDMIERTSMTASLGHGVRLVKDCQYTPAAIDNTAAEEKATKRLINGQIYILRGDKTYTVTGQEVR